MSARTYQRTFSEREVSILRDSLQNEETRLRLRIEVETAARPQHQLHQDSIRLDIINQWEKQAAEICVLRLRI